MKRQIFLLLLLAFSSVKALAWSAGPFELGTELSIVENFLDARADDVGCKIIPVDREKSKRLLFSASATELIFSKISGKWVLVKIAYDVYDKAQIEKAIRKLRWKLISNSGSTLEWGKDGRKIKLFKSSAWILSYSISGYSCPQGLSDH